MDFVVCWRCESLAIGVVVNLFTANRATVTPPAQNGSIIWLRRAILSTDRVSTAKSGAERISDGDGASPRPTPPPGQEGGTDNLSCSVSHARNSMRADNLSSLPPAATAVCGHCPGDSCVLVVCMSAGTVYLRVFSLSGTVRKAHRRL